ncbi:MAG: DUF4159 domain-containing protein [Deltaproteobacteria bacterium]|nr:DUF4159 domain-containing protein [Deltaproteobacteria bacterium]
MQANELNRRAFLGTAAAIAAGSLLPRRLLAIGPAGKLDIVQLVYAGGNWHPRPSAIRRLAWEVHKRTAVDVALEPSHAKPTTSALSASPLAYLSGDRAFAEWEAPAVDALTRFLKLGGSLIIDPAFTEDGDRDGFEESVDGLLAATLKETEPKPIHPGHVLFRTFYELPRAVGREEGPPGLTGYRLGSREAVIRTRHDLGGAWARDNLGNWVHEVSPGGERQRENAFRLGVNLVMYALCLDYKNEQPHRRFGGSAAGE